MSDRHEYVVDALCRIFGHDWRFWGPSTSRVVCRRCDMVQAVKPDE